MECLISQENLQTLVNEYNYIVKFASTLSHFQFKHKSQNILCIELWTSSWGSYGSRISIIGITFRLVQSLSHICFFETPWNEACQPSLSFTISRSLLNLMSIELVIPSNHLIFCPRGSKSLLQHHAAAAAKSLQSCPTPCDPIDGNPPGSPVPGTLQARLCKLNTATFI